MPSSSTSTVRIDMNPAEGLIVATVELPVPAERAFLALASREVTDWWVRPGVFDTRTWMGDVRAGGRWEASGFGGGQPYVLEGEFLEVDSPRALAFTWPPRGTPGAPTTVTCTLEPHNEGTRLILRHSGFTSPQACERTAVGWRTSFDRLVEILTS